MADVERLMRRTQDGYEKVLACDDCELSAGYCTDCMHVEYALRRLCAYEDSGLTPEQCAELAKAEREGRLMIYPYSVGDTVYRLWYSPCRFGETMPDGMSCDGCPDYCDIKREVVPYAIRALEGNAGKIGELGKDYFLTREDAEAALAERINK